jgi:F-type H+-transporting ATPase subunit a
MKEEIGAHSMWTVPVLGTVHSDTVMTTWVVMIIAWLILGFIARSYTSPRATKAQTVFEGVVDYVSDTVYSALGRSGEPFVPFFISVFIFIFILNQFGAFPLKVLGLPIGGSPTADLNTTLALALMVWVTIQVTGFRRKGIGYLGHLTKPFIAVTPLNILDELLRPITLAARLFFNIFIGELLPVVVASIIIAKVSIGAFNLSLAAAIVPFLVQFFNLAVGSIQAFVFTLLGIVYMSLNLAEDH